MKESASSTSIGRILTCKERPWIPKRWYHCFLAIRIGCTWSILVWTSASFATGSIFYSSVVWGCGLSTAPRQKERWNGSSEGKYGGGSSFPIWPGILSSEKLTSFTMWGKKKTLTNKISIFLNKIQFNSLRIWGSKQHHTSHFSKNLVFRFCKQA